jgi:hypothetical protein
METTEKIVEAYVRYIKGWATIPNIKCPGQFEIDLIAIDLCSGERYHVECGVSVSGAYSKLTDKPFCEDDLKERVKKAGQRRTLGYFIDRKFSAPGVLETLKGYGFKEGNYKKVIVSWSWTDSVAKEAEKRGVVLWRFPDIMSEIADSIKKNRIYYTDDTLRTLHLFAIATDRGGQ